MSEQPQGSQGDGNDDIEFEHIVVCCDGTWCGDETGTVTNIKILANSFAGTKVTCKKPFKNRETKTIVRFFDGLGCDGSLFDYVTDGALAVSIKEKCVEAYKFIVKHYRPGCKVWMFGLSRGAHTIRIVAGMVNSCGILDRSKAPGDDWDQRMEEACTEVYSIHCSKDKLYKPDGDFCKKFRDAKSHVVDKEVGAPIRFLGLFDTVGALGVPRIVPGQKFGYEFYDQDVSSEVQQVCQALAVHDRMSVFEPCFARRRKDKNGNLAPNKYRNDYAQDQEVWFPGSHYDIGRQRLVFARKVEGLNWAEKGPRAFILGHLENMLHVFLDHTNILRINVAYTPRLSNPPLVWMINKVKDTEFGLLPNDPATYIRLYADDTPPPPLRWFHWQWPEATIDAYDTLCERFAPIARMALPLLASAASLLFSQQLLADRHIPLYAPEANFFCAEGEERAHERYTPYKSKAFQVYSRMLQWGDDGGLGQVKWVPVAGVRELEAPAVPPPGLPAEREHLSNTNVLDGPKSL